MRTRGLLLVIGALALTCFGATTAEAQRSNFGTIALRTGFTPDPHVARGTSGGGTDASNLNSSCNGQITGTPDHILNLQTDFNFLRIFAESSSDTTLVVRGPNNRFYCNDDTYGLNPSVEGRFARGTYRVWIGSYQAGENAAYQLKLTELQSVTPGSGGGASNNNNNNSGGGDANRGLQIDSNTGNFDEVNLRTGFTPDPDRHRGVSGGQLNATRLGGDCRGWIAGRPDHIMNLRTAFRFFRVFVTSDSDTTLVIRKPDGSFICNDDTNGLNPALEARRWRRGKYRIWVGSYAEGDNQQYNIGFTELESVRE